MSGRGRHSILCGLAGLGSLAASSALAAEQGEFMRDAMSSIGLIEPERPTIIYNERAPLVMPPALGAKGAPKRAGKGVDKADKRIDAAVPMSLPPPQTRAADPQWPKDPEISQRERAAVEAKKPIVRGAQGRMNDNNMTLSPEEMQSGRRAGAGLSSDPAPVPGGEARDASWFQTFNLFGGKREEAAPSVIEPSRDGLTDPPTGYRKAPVKVATPDQGPVGGSISGNEEADPRVFMREQGRR